MSDRGQREGNTDAPRVDKNEASSGPKGATSPARAGSATRAGTRRREAVRVCRISCRTGTGRRVGSA